LTFDNNGNETTDENGQTTSYDAWNRSINVKNAAGTAIASYSYDPRDRRVTEAAGGTDTVIYFTNQWQAIEEDQGGIVTRQNVWGLGYVNQLVERDDNSTSGSLGISGSGLGERLYAQQDADWNVTALVDTSGNVAERTVYSPYGSATFLTPSWTSTTDSYSQNVLFQGGRFEAPTDDYVFQRRDYDAATGAWDERDPDIYIDGADLYSFVLSDPVGSVDPHGLLGGQGRPQAPPPPVYATYPFVAGRGTFDAKMGVHIGGTATPGPTGGITYTPVPDTDAVDMSIWFHPNATVKNSNPPLCTKIDFVTYYTDKYLWFRFSSWTYNPWQLDDGDPYGSGPKTPAPMNSPWTPGGVAILQDAPGDNNLYYWEVNYKTQAINRAGTENGKSYGTLDWGLVLDYSRNVKQYTIAGKKSNWLPIADIKTTLTLTGYIPTS
jgi:RHS repeat-associated protein